MKYGEKGNLEYNWTTNNIKNKLVEFNYQLVRTSNLQELEDVYRELINETFCSIDENITIEKRDLANLTYKLIGETRDVILGKGEYNLTYMMISVIALEAEKIDCFKTKNNMIKLAQYAIYNLIYQESNYHQLGSWKDIKYFSEFWRKKKNVDSKNEKELVNFANNDNIMKYIIELTCNTLFMECENKNYSLLGKWLPREKSKKFGWLNKLLAYKYYDYYIENANNIEKKIKAKKKCIQNFRVVLSHINKVLQTTQVYQCENKWNKIDFSKNVTSITMRKQSLAFQNVDKLNNKRKHKYDIQNNTRETCSENYKFFLEECKKDNIKMKGKQVSIIDLVRDAINVNEENNNEIDCINRQWESNKSYNSELQHMLPLIDISDSMKINNRESLYSAIGLGLRIAEKSKMGKRVIAYSTYPVWINLDDCDDFVSSVKKINSCNISCNNNFDSVIDLIVVTAIKNNLSPIEVSKMTLVILSDMQIDNNILRSNQTVYDIIKSKYEDSGKCTIWNKKYDLPHLIFWNMRNTSGFPALTSTNNVSMISGTNPRILNIFSKKGLKGFGDRDAYSLLKEKLDNKRYDNMDYIIDRLWYEQHGYNNNILPKNQDIVKEYDYVVDENMYN